ncbi:hemerythrin domain-containing protein [Methylobacterium phyllosphaerae]
MSTAALGKLCMDVWKLIERDHKNIAGLIREIPYALNDPRAVGSRERMLADLTDELEMYATALDASLYSALSREGKTRALIEDLHRGHAEFRRQLQQLARYRRKHSAGWLNMFEDVTFLVDQHLHRHVHELVPAARTLFSLEEVNAATRAYVRAKTSALQSRRRGAGDNVMSSEAALITTAAAVAAGLGYLMWRSGVFDGRRSVHASRAGERHAR